MTGRAEVDDSLAELAPPPLGQQQAHQRLAAARWQLQRYVRCVQRLGHIVAQHLALVVKQAGVLAPRQVAEQTVRAFGDCSVGGGLFECHGLDRMGCGCTCVLALRRVFREPSKQNGPQRASE